MYARFQILHHPTVAYTLWSNGTVERVYREILYELREMLVELRIKPQYWSSLLTTIPTLINEVPNIRLGAIPTMSIGLHWR